MDKCHALGSLCHGEACTALLCCGYAKQIIFILLPNIKAKYCMLFVCSMIADLEAVETIICFGRKHALNSAHAKLRLLQIAAHFAAP